VGQGGLRQVQALGGLHQAVGFAQGMQGFQVTEFKHGATSPQYEEILMKRRSS
jgi:hypothetical protein